MSSTNYLEDDSSIKDDCPIEFVPQGTEMYQINNYAIKKIVSELYPQLSKINIKCEKVLNGYYRVDDIGEYKRQIILTTNSDIEEKYIIKEILDSNDDKRYQDISMCKGKVIGVFSYHDGYHDPMAPIETTNYQMIYLSDRKAEKFFCHIKNNVSWLPHPEDDNLCADYARKEYIEEIKKKYKQIKN
jgi:hypothetical protein